MPLVIRTFSKLFSPRYLLLTNTVASGLLMGGGDLMVQSVERIANKKRLHYDWHRTGRLVIVGLVFGPITHYWYNALERLLPGKSIYTVVRKILMDQTFAGPTSAFIFFMGTGILEGQTIENSWKEFKAKFWGVYKADWAVWPAAQSVNFYFLPAQFRVVYVCTVTLFWNTFLSYTKHKDNTGDAVQQQQQQPTAVHTS